MTQDNDRAGFLDRFRYKLYGIVFEATTMRFNLKDGGVGYEECREKLMRECDKWLTAVYDDLAVQNAMVKTIKVIADEKPKALVPDFGDRK